jgi:membrane protease YdiL (CAAX protease family)
MRVAVSYGLTDPTQQLTVFTNQQPAATSSTAEPLPIRRWTLWTMARRHPLTVYFAIAYLGAWIPAVSLALSQRGLKVIAIPDGLALGLFLLANYTGPFLAAFLVTAATDGRAGVGQLLRRLVQWRIGVGWYLLALFAYPLIFAVGLLPTLGPAALVAIVQKWPLFLTVYLPTIPLSIVVFGTLGEETGWRGVALPRLQLRHGALVGTLILAGLHALWHTPAYFIPGAILPGAFDPVVFVANSLAIVAEAILWTWVFNRARGSVLIAILFHAASNANSAYFPQLLPLPHDPWATFKILGVCALVVIVATRGRLGYQPLPSSSS